MFLTVSFASLLSGGALVALSAGPGPGGGSDHGLDANGNGRFDWLVVRMDLRVDTANWYNVWATLGTESPIEGACGSYGSPMPLGREAGVPNGLSMPQEYSYPISWASLRQFFEAGDHEVSLAFKGTDIGYAGVDGPYVVHAQVYADGEWDPRVMEPALFAPVPGPSGWDWTYVTRRYDADSFEEPRFAVRLTGEPGDSGLDLDADGLYDYLVVETKADVRLAGTYTISGTLTIREGEWGRWIASSWGSVNLTEGRQTVEYRFNGGDIWASGSSGSFDFTLDIGYGGNVWYGGGDPNGTLRGEVYLPQPDGFDHYGDHICGATSEYRHEQFEERVEPAKYTGVFRDYGEDRDASGLFDALVVEAEVEVIEANLFDFSGQLMSEDGSAWISFAFEQRYLEEGVTALALRFAGADLRRSGVDGPYRVDLNLVVANRDPAATIYTAAYRHTEFEGEETRAQTHWIGELSADGSTISVTVIRGKDLLTYVVEDTLTVEAHDAQGQLTFRTRDKVYLPSGGSSQSFTFSWQPDPGTYLVRATLGPSDAPNDVVEIHVTV